MRNSEQGRSKKFHNIGSQGRLPEHSQRNEISARKLTTDGTWKFLDLRQGSQTITRMLFPHLARTPLDEHGRSSHNSWARTPSSLPTGCWGMAWKPHLKAARTLLKHDIGTDANYATTRKSDKQGKGLPHSTARKLLVTTCW